MRLSYLLKLRRVLRLTRTDLDHSPAVDPATPPETADDAPVPAPTPDPTPAPPARYTSATDAVAAILAEQAAVSEQVRREWDAQTRAWIRRLYVGGDPDRPLPRFPAVDEVPDVEDSTFGMSGSSVIRPVRGARR